MECRRTAAITHDDDGVQVGVTFGRAAKLVAVYLSAQRGVTPSVTAVDSDAGLVFDKVSLGVTGRNWA
jgi:hypothetical protein